MKIAMLAKKGGVGKSTLTILLYEALRQAGKTVQVQDWDAQGTSSKALELFASPSAAAPPEIVLYDTPPNLEHTATAVAVQNANIVLILTTPSPADIWESEDALQFAEARNPSAIRRVVYNKVRRSTILGRLLDQQLPLSTQAALGARLSARECYQHALAQGWKALDGAAREEVLQLGLAVLSLSHPAAARSAI
jgi:chromosome partitioning protein